MSNGIPEEAVKNIIQKVVDNWDNTGLAFLVALVGATGFCFAAIYSNDGLSVWLQLFGIIVIYLMMLKLPVYYVAKKKGFSDKPSASLGLAVCFLILTALLLVHERSRDLPYYFGLFLTLWFALLMVWLMSTKDSKINVRKTFTASTVLILVQCVLGAIMWSETEAKEGKLGLQTVLVTLLLFICIRKLIRFLRNKDVIERQIELEAGDEQA